MQVSSHLNTLLNHFEEFSSDKTVKKSSNPATKDGETPTKKPPPHVSVAAVVGGMSSQKQRRILDRGVDVLIATPGRLWDLIEDVGSAFANHIKSCLNLHLG